MGVKAKVVIGLAGTAALTAGPFLWWAGSPWAWAAVPVVVAWGVWLVAEYLRWARSLRQR